MNGAHPDQLQPHGQDHLQCLQGSWRCRDPRYQRRLETDSRAKDIKDQDLRISRLIWEKLELESRLVENEVNLKLEEAKTKGI